MDYSTKNICGYTAVCQFDEPVLICQSLTTAQTICKLMEEDAKGNVHPLCCIDVEAAKLGKWIDSSFPNEKYVCSECHGACWYYDINGRVSKSRFCPNCGAKMENAE